MNALLTWKTGALRECPSNDNSPDMMSASSGERASEDDFDTETSDEEMSDVDDHDEASCL